MTRYYASFVATATYSTEIEADSYEEAQEQAWELGVPGLCHQEDVEIAGDWEIDTIEEIV